LLIAIRDPQVVATSGKTHHTIAAFWPVEKSNLAWFCNHDAFSFSSPFWPVRRGPLPLPFWPPATSHDSLAKFAASIQ
jgi:hypothetical protein